MENPEKFLSEKYPELPGSRPVERAVAKKIRKGEKGPQTKEERVEAYLERLEDIIKDKRGFGLLKYAILEKYITKYEEIPESYWKAQEEEMRRRGEAADWTQATEEQREEIKRKTAEAVLTDQRASLEQWLDYFASSDSDHIPRSLKYWVFRSILNLQELVKKKEDGREYIEFPRRSRGTVKPYPDINYEALAYVVDAMVKKLQGQGIEFGYDIQPEEQEVFLKFLQKQDFAKLYAWANELMQPIPKHLLPVTDGKWIKYEQGSDPQELVKTIRGKGTGWCTAGLNTARTHLKGGDFYVYYSLDDNGEPTMPRIAIRMEGHDKIAEDPRGIAYKENLDPYMGPILEEKLKEFGPVGDAYKKKSADMRRLTEIENKTGRNETLGREDLVFLYELESPIEGFGYRRDSRIQELRSQRNPEKDQLIIFQCTKEQIAHNPAEINANTKAYVGKLEPGIFDFIQKYNIEHVYTEFPEGRLKFKTIRLESGLKQAADYRKALQKGNYHLSEWTDDLLSRMKPSERKKETNLKLVILSVADMGFKQGATTREIYARAKELGLELASAEAGPELRLQYDEQPKGDYVLIGMESIADRDGRPRVFSVHRDDDGGAWLHGNSGPPDDWWTPGNRWAFVSRKF